MTRRCVSAFICFLMLVCFAVIPATAVSAAGKDDTIKVAVLNNSMYAYQDRNKVWRGMDVEIMINVAQKTGMNIEFVDSSTDPDFLENLDNGTYDIVADVVKTPEREDKYLFTDEMIGTNNSTLAVRASDSRWTYGNIEQISKMKIGVLSSYANNDDFRVWCDEHDVTPVIQEYDNIEAMAKALEEGKIDGQIYSAGNGSRSSAQFHTILKFLPESYYFAFRKNDVGLKNKVDEGIAQILSGNVDYFLSLKSKYETQFRGNVLPISTAEKTYIEKHPVINVGVLNGDEPYYKKSRNGIIPDYYKLIAKYSGLSFKYKVYDTQKELLNACRTGEIDVIGVYGDGMITAYQRGLTLTDSFTTVNNVMMTRQGDNASKVKTAAVKSSSVHSLGENSNELLSGVRLIEYKSADECFEAMQNGDVDGLVIGMPSATWLVNQNNSASYSIVPIAGVTTDLCSAMNVSNQTLCSIMNKSIAATKSNFNGIITKDTVPQNGWKAVITRIPPAIVVFVVLALVILVLGLIWSMVMLRRRQKERNEVLAAQAEARLEKVQAEESQKNIDSKNAFFSNISHDMRTPLNAIIGFTRMARRTDISDETKDEYLKNVEDSSVLLLELINDTLALSKMNSGKLSLNLSPVSTETVIRETIIPLREIAEQKNISIDVDRTHFSDRTLLMDKLNVQKILLNIINNAVKYTESGGHICIKLSDEPANGSDPDFVVSVRDDGIGIAEEFMPHLFEPFSQEKRLDYASVGTGLGLSIVKELVDLMGGTIDVQSEKNIGTVFTVRLHFEKVEGFNVKESERSDFTEVDLSGKRALLCEDNKLNQEIAVVLLHARGIDTEVASDGAIGVQKFASSEIDQYDFILMDLRMPGKDGIEATREIRAMNRADAGTIPIIAMTADAFDDDIWRCLSAGMNAHISKPIDPDVMYNTIAEQIL